MKRVLFTICTYNELENIRDLLAELRAVAPDADIVVIDDNSPDGTGAAVREMMQTDEKISLLHRPKKDGLGAATLAGFRYAIEHRYDTLLNLDADFSHNPKYVPNLLAASERADVVIGSRYVDGGRVQGWSLKRHIMSQCINLYARVMLGLTTRDNSGAFRCYSVNRLAQIDWSETLSRGYAFQEEVLYRCRAIGCSFVEVPISFEDRRFGETKISWQESVLAVWILFRLALQRLTGRPVALDRSQPAATGGREHSTRTAASERTTVTSDSSVGEPSL